MTKYKAHRTEVDGIVFHSKKESLRYSELKFLFRVGEIFDLAIQPEFEFKLNGKRMFRYISDFSYTDKDGTKVVKCTAFKSEPSINLAGLMQA